MAANQLSGTLRLEDGKFKPSQCTFCDLEKVYLKIKIKRTVMVMISTILTNRQLRESY